MIDFHIQLIADILLMGFSASYYHIVYYMFDYVRNDIDKYYSIIKRPIIIMVLLLVTQAVNERGSKMNGIFDVILYYTMVIYVIMEFGNDSRYLLLGVSTAFFLSEYWETPIYLWRIFIRGTYAQYNPLHNVYIVLKYFLKILTVFYMKIEMDLLGLNIFDFLKDLSHFSIIYFPSVFLFFMINDSNAIGGLNFNWLFRLLCFGVMIQYLYKERNNNIVMN